jgi:hypothetical protein
MHRTVALALLVGAVATASCGEQYEDPNSETCQRYGSITNLSAEPRYSANHLHRWSTSDGCALRLDVLMTRQGEDACGGEEVADILMGTPLGASTERSEARTFIRDPNGILTNRRTSEAFDADAELPPNAKATGFQQDDYELWMLRGKDDFVYLVDEEGNVEAWPRPRGPVSVCG